MVVAPCYKLLTLLTLLTLFTLLTLSTWLTLLTWLTLFVARWCPGVFSLTVDYVGYVTMWAM